jgi:hypothetical protein
MPQTAAGRPVRIDLRSDTVSLPTREMRAAMAAAEVGDDVYGDDPSIRRLEERAAEILGKDAAVFTPTGTMSNQIAIRCQTEPGDLILAERRAHAHLVESGGPAALSGATVVGLDGDRGVFSADQVRAAVRVERLPQPAHVHVDGPALDEDVRPPHRIEQLLAREHAARMLHQVAQQAEFGRAQMHRRVAPRDPVCG